MRYDMGGMSDESNNPPPGGGLASSETSVDRRRLLQGVGSAIVTARLGGALIGCGGSSDTPTNPDTGTSSGSSGSGAGSSGTSGAPGSSGAVAPPPAEAGVCELYPQQAVGPYYLDGPLVRSDITEGKTGVGLTLRFEVLRASSCAPIEGAVVDVWHNDAGGVYSGYPGQVGGVDTSGQKFLRGMQPTNASGEAELRTIYPGWYPGRTTHIHFKVHLPPQNQSVVTSQMYFPEDVNASVYASALYAARGQKDTTNVRDGIAGTSQAVLAAVTGDPTRGYVATLTITVRAT
jgi:protocatechuate 3,4-dioxygenase beta subunit